MKIGAVALLAVAVTTVGVMLNTLADFNAGGWIAFVGFILAMAAIAAARYRLRERRRGLFR